MGQHYTGKNLVQYCPRGSQDNNAQEKILFNVVLNSWDIIPQVKTLCSVAQEAPDNIVCTGKNPVQCCLNIILLEKIAQVNTLCNVVLGTPDNTAQEIILFNVVLILLEQHSTSKYTLCNENILHKKISSSKSSMLS